MNALKTPTDDDRDEQDPQGLPDTWRLTQPHTDALSAEPRHRHDIKATTLLNGKPTNFEDVREGRAVYIGRANDEYGLEASDWSNPHSVSEHGRNEAVRRYLDDFYGRIRGQGNEVARSDLQRLYGRPLACWCIDQWEEPRPLCHGHVIALHLAYRYHTRRSFEDVEELVRGTIDRIIQAHDSS